MCQLDPSINNRHPSYTSHAQSTNGIILHPNSPCILGLREHALADLLTQNEVDEKEGKPLEQKLE